MMIYRFLLEHMTDEHRFQLTAKLCQDVLADVADGTLRLEIDSIPLLQDTLAVLSSKVLLLRGIIYQLFHHIMAGVGVVFRFTINVPV